jgi:hypothetical protein
MAVIKLLRRVQEASLPFIAAKPFGKPLWPIKGLMHPNLCPAIRDANARGLLMSALHDLSFEGPDSFEVSLGCCEGDEVLVVPGVIGSPDSTILFAKVDTGLSVDDLPIEWLALPLVNLEFSLNLIVPGVIYPKGYSGPLFVAVASRSKIRVPAGYPLSQLVAIDGQEVELELSENLSSSRRDKNFQGLLCPGWCVVEQHGKRVSARQCLELFRQYSEIELANLLRE